jgi:nucleotide-binding universal stress UspA family protein
MPGIVVGYDGSENAEYALRWAMQRAVAEHLPLTVLTVNEVAMNPYTGQPSVIAEDAVMLGKARQAAVDVVAKVSGDLGSPPAVSVSAVSGLAGEELILASRDAEMLVIGSRGEREFPALRVSEVATKVAHYSSCPIVIVPPAR